VDKGGRNLGGILKTLGPGLLFAGAAIGGSHLVQSTRAGANYGFALVWLLVIALVLKYPFFEFSHRYTAATGKSVLVGYLELGRPALIAFLVLATVAAFLNVAGVTLVTASLAGFLLNVHLPPVVLTTLMICIVASILLIGKYAVLDKINKCMLVILGITTIICVIFAAANGPVAGSGFQRPPIWNIAGISFLLALMGWMPAPIDVSVWPSLWRLERSEQTKYHPSMEEVQVDFNTGYIATGILALAFLGLGALVMFGTGKEFSNSGIRFAGQLVDLYTDTIGRWTFPLIGLCVFSTMFSTTMATVDGYTRTLKDSCELLLPALGKHDTLLYRLFLGILIGATIAIVGMFLSGIKSLIDFATILAFLSAPVFAYLNYRVVTMDTIPTQFLPPLHLKILSWLGIIFLSGFSLIFIYCRFCL